MEKAAFKTVFFKDKDTADRVALLFNNQYVNKVSKMDTRYYGDWCNNWYYITLRKTNTEIDKIANDIGLKEVRKNNKKCWIFID